MEALIAKQLEIGQTLDKLLINFRKDSAKRKTIDYVKKRIEIIELNWTAFETNHQNLIKNYSESADSHYFTTNYYEKVKALKETTLTMLTDLKEDLQEEPADLTGGDEKATIPGPSSDAFKLNYSTDPDYGLDKLIKKQIVLLNVITKQLETIESRLANESEMCSISYCKYHINLLNNHHAEAMNTHKIICESIVEGTKCDYQEEKFFEITSWLENILIELEERQRKLNKIEQSPQIAPPNHGKMKLPKITIPIFDGNYLKWTQFRDLYVQLVHNQDISSAEKMFYLVSNLSGEALGLIKHFSVTAENYEDAWTIIQNRYDNKRLLVTTLLNKLLSQPSLQSESATAIRALHDTTKECLLGLKNLSIAIDTWDAILVHILLKKLDKTTHSLYEQSIKSPREVQSCEDLLKFLESRFQSLEAVGGKSLKERPQNQLRQTLVTTKSVPNQCVLCKEHHQLYFCKKFLDQSPAKRYQTIKNLKLCVNCLKKGHSAAECTLRGCSKCSKKHNSLVHFEDKQLQKVCSNTPMESSLPSSANEKSKTALGAQQTTAKTGYVILSTMRIKAKSGNKEVECRAILDSGSQVNFVTRKLARLLNLKEYKDNISISGIGQGIQRSQNRVNIHIESLVTGFSTNLEAHVLSKITEHQPSRSIDVSQWNIPKNIDLADPTFFKPQDIDILIGAEFYYDLISIGQIKLGNGLPTLQKTVFGWVVSGKVNDVDTQSSTCGICTKHERNVEDQIERFWKLEENETTSTLTVAERKCENHFNQTVRRQSDGRFIVRLPFLKEVDLLGDSTSIAMTRLRAMERKFVKNPELKEEYIAFMREYENLNHMEEIDYNSLPERHYFIPHHCVLKPDSTSTKLRVVFDASAPTTTNISLNEILHSGPKVQEDLFSVLIRFRLPKYVFSADIEKMYRQILIHPDDRQFQLIWWREDENKPPKCYQLRTVTYGVTSAPYLAIKCLRQLAIENKEKYPLGALALNEAVYVDDVMGGSDSLCEALRIQEELNHIMQSAQLKLRKWCANHDALLQNIRNEDKAPQLTLSENADCKVKTLGLIWSPRSDEFTITTWNNDQCKPQKVTKRIILSEIAHLFDPLGLVSPVVVLAKIFLQELWKLKLDWDASIPMELYSKWIKFYEGLSRLNSIKIPRHVIGGIDVVKKQLHVFGDASEKAYGAVVYVRSQHKDGTIRVRLLCAKSRVAPVKQITIPRLELCAAKLAVSLYQRVQSDLHWKEEAFLWTDSTTVLGWINSQSSNYLPFVANRLSYIHEFTTENQWKYVPTKENPADLVSRGVQPDKFKDCNLWFYGPLFLYGPDSTWPAKPNQLPTELEQKRIKTALVSSHNAGTSIIDSIDHKNSFTHLQRIIGYVLRFVQATRRCSKEVNKELSAIELHEALEIIIKGMQQQGFSEDLTDLHKTGAVSSTSAIKTLHPFVDRRGIIRVGGRLSEAEIPYDAKHPILMPYGHELTKVLMHEIHVKNSHVGPQGLLSIVRQRFWPVKAKTIARNVVQNCVRCSRAKPKILHQLMGDLPADRVQPARPFINSGVDFCGPFWIHFKIRGKRPVKAYVAIFCCFATKAVHIEVVSDLTTDAFIGALKRFIGRRGHCRKLYSDNATNFVGARNQLEELQQSIFSEKSSQSITRFCTAKGIDFHFIPPRAPHFGGLWEAAVKSAKNLFHRSVHAANLTQEELTTVMVEIEAILNSRPLTPMSADPNDLTALTPGHFLIGEPLTATVDPHARESKASLAQRWKLVAQLKMEFWNRWSKEYLAELQHRYKWHQPQENIQPGLMVVLKEDNMPVLSWPLGRVIGTVKGKDGMVRVADVKTSAGILRRPIQKLAPLPIQYESKEAQECVESMIDTEEIQKNTDNEGKSSPVAKRRRIRLSPLHALISILCFIPTIYSANVIVTPFKDQPGLYFENIGSTYLISTEWNLVMYLEMKNYWGEVNIIQHGISHLTYICQALVDKRFCNETIHQFLTVAAEIEDANSLLLPKSNNRYKRAPLDIVGNIANSLFGVLDSSYAEQMSDIIDDLKGDQRHLYHLLQNQTSILDATSNIIKRSQEQFENHINELNEKLNQTITIINDLQSELRTGRLIEIFNELSSKLILATVNYQRMQSVLLDVIIHAHNGKINPILFTPKQLQQQINIIRQKLPSNLQLPVVNDHLLEYYNLMTIESRIIEDRIIFRLRLPLLTHEIFELFKITSIPILTEKTFLWIEPYSNYIIINLHRDMYYPLNSQELSKCFTIGKSRYLCRQQHPLYRKGAELAACEINILTQANDLQPCKFSNSKMVQTWTPLASPNQWMYALKEETVLNIICGHTLQQRTVIGSGILQLPLGCLINDGSTNIYATNLRSSSFTSAFHPARNITSLLTPFNVHNLTFHSSHLQNLTHNITDLQTQIETLQHEENIDRAPFHHFAHQLSVSYTGLAIVITVIIYLVWQKFRNSKESSKPTPAPRNTAKEFHLQSTEDS